jgi:excisionase family DNA binding protein
MKKNSMQPTALTVCEVAQRLSVSQSTVYRMLDSGQLQGVRAGRLWRVPVAALDEYLRSPAVRTAVADELSVEDLAAVQASLAAIQPEVSLSSDARQRERANGNEAPSAEDLDALQRGLADVKAGRYVPWRKLRESLG